jgi:2-oxoglutarate dehydrogenase complex dehydrogenase (E1) component-like enzyme
MPCVAWLAILFLLTRRVGFQNFVRFSLEGCEALIPALSLMMQTAAEYGAQEITMGMAHRGRLNVIANVSRFSYPYPLPKHDFSEPTSVSLIFFPGRYCR